jgi:hypothetical protein
MSTEPGGNINDIIFVDLLGADSRAVALFVGPMRLLHPVMASCLLRTKANTGPLVMKSTNRSKNGFPKCSA